MSRLIVIFLLINSVTFASTVVEKNYLKLSEKRGKMLKVWDQFIAEAKKGNEKAMESIFHASTLHLSGFYLSTYKYDLHLIFKTNPKFFISTGKKYFKDDGICNMYWLLPRTGEVEPNAVYSTLKKYPELSNDLSLAKKFSSYSDKKRNDSTKNCYKVLQ
jgi:hypothetical protein